MVVGAGDRTGPGGLAAASPWDDGVCGRERLGGCRPARTTPAGVKANTLLLWLLYCHIEVVVSLCAGE